MSDKRQKNQLVLAFTEEGRSAAPKASQEGTESLTAKCETERPASHEPLMEEVCERENCWQAYKRVKANQGSPGIDGMKVGELSGYLKQQSGADDEGTCGLLTGLEELLRLLSDPFAAEDTGSMDPASSTIHDLEAMETRHNAVREATSPRGRKGSRCTNGGQSSRPMATGE